MGDLVSNYNVDQLFTDLQVTCFGGEERSDLSTLSSDEMCRDHCACDDPLLTSDDVLMGLTLNSPDRDLRSRYVYDVLNGGDDDEKSMDQTKHHSLN
jgi:hypothetical protein